MARASIDAQMVDLRYQESAKLCDFRWLDVAIRLAYDPPTRASRNRPRATDGPPYNSSIAVNHELTPTTPSPIAQSLPRPADSECRAKRPNP